MREFTHTFKNGRFNLKRKCSEIKKGIFSLFPPRNFDMKNFIENGYWKIGARGRERDRESKEMRNLWRIWHVSSVVCWFIFSFLWLSVFSISKSLDFVQSYTTMNLSEILKQKNDISPPSHGEINGKEDVNSESVLCICDIWSSLFLNALHKNPIMHN